MAKPKTKKKVHHDPVRPDRLILWVKVVDHVGAIIHRAIAAGAVVWIGSYVFRSVQALAGKATTADLVFKLLGNIMISQTVAWAFGASGLAYGGIQRSLRRKAIGRQQGRVKDLEARIDPNRTSSGLTEKGDTHPEDLP